MIMIAVMNRQFLQGFTRKFARTTATNPGIHFQRLCAVTLFPLLCGTPGLCDDLVEFVRVLF
jgi:hypothetical protein